MKNRKTRKLLQTSLLKLLTVASFFSLPLLTLAAPGDLDPTFGNGGIVITTVDPSGRLVDVANGMAMQPDGKIVVAGVSYNNSGHAGIAVVRYHPNGSLDSSFGGAGIVITPVNINSEATSVALQADGKIVVAGFSYNSDGVHSFAVVRYHPNGSLDTSFNGTGKVITPIDSASTARSVAVQTDGKIVVAGESSGSSGSRFTVVRYNTNGSLDTSFDNDGIVTTGVGGAFAVAIQADGKIVAAGTGVVRCNADGSLDTTFNGTGIITTPDNASSVAIQADGKILTAGENRLVRYNANGTPDTSFGGTGGVAVGISVYSAVVQTDGKIVAAGRREDGNSGFVVVRRNPNGSLDTTFGNGTGRVFTLIGEYNFAHSVAIQADGKIVVAGYTADPFDFLYYAVVRYQGGSNANIRTRFDFDGDGRADVSVFRSTDRTWYLDQSTNGFFATQFGLSTDKITPSDFDGDGRTDISVYREGVWYWINSSNGTVGINQFGLASDIPQPADFTGDGRADLAIYRNGTWWSLNLSNNQVNTIQFGLPTDKPVVADYDGDGRADQAIYRNGEWHLNRSTQGYAVVNFGLATDKPTVGDYDGDGRADQAVYRDGVWYVLRSSQGFTAFQFGLASDIPAPADYDGDGKTDAAVFRDGVWYLQQTTNGISVQPFGLTNDKPVPSAYLP